MIPASLRHYTQEAKGECPMRKPMPPRDTEVRRIIHRHYGIVRAGLRDALKKLEKSEHALIKLYTKPRGR